MPKPIANVSLPKVKIEKNLTVHAFPRSPRACAFAQPLFDENIDVFGYCERISRQIHKNFVPGQYHQFYFILQGNLEYQCGDKHLHGSRNQILLLPAGHSYKRLKISKGLRYIFFKIMPSEEWQSLSDLGPYTRTYQDIDLVYSMTTKVLNRIHHESLALRRVCLEYSRMLLNLLLMEKAQSGKEKSQETRVNQLSRLVRQNLLKKWTTQEMADHLSVSQSTLNRLCHRYYNSSAINLVIKLRMERAIQFLISNEHSIAKIANMVGYANASVFSSLFLKHTGTRPGAFRKTHRGGNW